MSDTNNFCRSIITALLVLAVPSACTGVSVSSRHELADRIASGHGMTEQTIDAAPFRLTAFARIARAGAPATVYIEGDGFAWLDRSTPSGDPTPKNPIALRLAAADSDENVIYLARPCQFGGEGGNMFDGGVPGGLKRCPQNYWTGARLAPEVISSLNTALDELKRRYRITSFNLTGFSGGAGAAVLVAARRHDIVGLRTVAGNLDQAMFTRLHGVSPMTASLDPRAAAAGIANIPQIHFVGRDDPVVPPALAESFLRAAGSPRCTALKIIDISSHDEAWVALWPTLNAVPLPCTGL